MPKLETIIVALVVGAAAAAVIRWLYRFFTRNEQPVPCHACNGSCRHLKNPPQNAEQCDESGKKVV